MNLEARMAASFRPDRTGWRRHANPWIVYTRVPVPAPRYDERSPAGGSLSSRRTQEVGR